MRHRIAKQALECPHCRTTQVCEIERDEDGAYCEIETEPCHADGCTVRLCRSCPQSECVECGLVHCEDHSIITAAGPTCPLCFQKAVADGVSARTLMQGGCEVCDGTGEVEVGGNDTASNPPQKFTCTVCRGSGQRVVPEVIELEDGRDDDDVRGQDSYTLGAERCPPRE